MNKNFNGKTVCIFCSSSADVSDEITKAGKEFSSLLARNGFGLLYGGTTKGFMKTNADAYKAAGGTHLAGVIPGYMTAEGKQYPDLDEIYTVDDIRERKGVMLEKSDIIVALPGGIGTFDEFFDLLTLKYLKRHDKPMFLLNTNGFYDLLLKVFDHGVKENTIKQSTLELFKTVSTPQQLIEML